MHKISVLMSVYKEPVDWIRQSIDSILNQTYTNFEFIIVNDNPDRDENSQLLKDYLHRDERIRIITNEKNIGLTKSLNRGLAIAQGEYVARMDADDISHPNRLEKQIDYLNQNPSIAICGTSAEIIDSHGISVGYIPVFSNDRDIKTLLLVQSAFVHPSVMWRSCNNLLYDEDFRFSQDYKLWVNCYNLKFSNIPDRLIKYRVTDQQITSKNRFEQILLSKKIMQCAFVNAFGDSPSHIINPIFNLIYNREVIDCATIFKAIIDLLEISRKRNLNISILRRCLLSNLSQYIKQCSLKCMNYNVIHICRQIGFINSMYMLYYYVKDTLK